MRNPSSAFCISSLNFEYNVEEKACEVGYETVDWIMAAYGLCSNVAFGHAPSLLIRLAGGRLLGGALFRRERIDVGAHEAPFLANAGLCRSTATFLSRTHRFLVHQAPWNPLGALAHPHFVLHLQRGHRPLARLAQHRHFLYWCGSNLSL